MNNVHILLLAADGLEHEKVVFGDLVENLNYSLECRDFHLLMDVCDETMSDDYFMSLLEKCDLCLIAFYDTISATNKGKLDKAYNCLINNNNCPKLLVYFKESVNNNPEIQEFRDGFTANYGHFLCSFDNDDMLRADFLLQFINFYSNLFGDQNLLEIKDGCVLVDGKGYVNLERVPFTGNNEEYRMLLKNIKSTKKILSVIDKNDPDYLDYSQDLTNLLERRNRMESNLWETAQLITQLCTQQCSDRLERAKGLFIRGDNNGAMALLEERTIDQEMFRNIELIKMGKDAQNALKLNIEEYRLKISTLSSAMPSGWSSQVVSLYERLLSMVDGYASKEDYVKLLEDYVHFLDFQRMYNLIGYRCEKAILLYRELEVEDFKHSIEKEIELLLLLGNANMALFEFDAADNNYKTCLCLLFAFLDDDDLGVDLSSIQNYCFRTTSALNNRYEEIIRKKDLISHRSNNSIFFVATILSSMGILYHKLNRYEDAEVVLKKSLELHRILAGKKKDVYNLEYASTLKSLGSLHHHLCLFDESEKELEESIQVLKDLLSNSRDSLNYNDYLADYADALSEFSSLHKTLKHYGEAERECEESLECYKILSNENPNKYLDCQACQIHNLGLIHLEQDRLDTAEEEIQEGLLTFRRLPLNKKDSFQINIAHSFDILGQIHFRKNQYKEAGCDYQESLNIKRQLRQKHPDIYSYDVAVSLYELSSLHKSIGLLEQAADECRESCLIFNQLSNIKPEVYLKDVAACLNLAGLIYKDLGDKKAAEVLLADSLRITRNLSKKYPNVYEAELAHLLCNLGSLHRTTKKYKDSEKEYQESLLIFRQLAGSNPERYLNDVASLCLHIALLHKETSRYAEAEKELNENIRIKRLLYEKNSGMYLFDVAESLIHLGYLFQSMRRFDEAESRFKESLEIKRSYVESSLLNPLELAVILLCLGDLHDILCRFDESEVEYKECLEIIRQQETASPGNYTDDLIHTLEKLRKLHQKMNRFEVANEEYEEICLLRST